MDDKLLITNEMLKSALVKEYKNFVDSVDTSEVVDLLIQEQIITIEEGIKCRKKDSRQEGCRFLLDKIFTTNNPTSCIVLCDALKELYPWIYESILKTVNSHAGNFEDKVDNEKFSILLLELEEKKSVIKNLRNEIERLKSLRAIANGIEDAKNIHQHCEKKIQDLSDKLNNAEKEIEVKKIENINLCSHVLILENQIKATASNRISQGNLLDYDEAPCDTNKGSFKHDTFESNKKRSIHIIHPEDLIKVSKLPKYCGSYYDLYNGRYGQECLSISIKEIIKETKEAEEDKLRKEASLSCQFHHSRLTQLLGQSGDTPVSYLVYEASYIPNTLNYLKYKISEVDNNFLIRWCVQIACALDYIHGKRVILRNVNLENILVVNKGDSIKLTNFEFAVQLPDDLNDCYYDSNEYTARTMEKLAPEIWKDNLWYFSTDVWSFALSAIKLFNRGAKLFPFKTERDVKSLLNTSDTLADQIKGFRFIQSSVLRQTLSQCLLTDHLLRPPTNLLTSFQAYQPQPGCTCSQLKNFIENTLVEHILENKMQVKAITTLNNHLYFLVNSSSSIKTYRMSNGYVRLHSIKLGLSRRNTLKAFFRNLKDQSDSTKSEKNITPSQKLLSLCGSGDILFVLDGENSCVWKVSSSKSKIVGFFEVPEQSVSIDCFHNGIFVFFKFSTPSGFNAIEFNYEGVFMRYLIRGLEVQPLLKGVCIDSLHTLVLCGEKREDEDSLQLKVVDSDGTQSSGFKSHYFQNISDIVYHRPSKTILLTDLSKNRVLMLDTHLQSEPILLFNMERGINLPSAIHIDSDGFLFVGLVSGNVCCFHYKYLESPPINDESVTLA